MSLGRKILEVLTHSVVRPVCIASKGSATSMSFFRYSIRVSTRLYPCTQTDRLLQPSLYSGVKIDFRPMLYSHDYCVTLRRRFMRSPLLLASHHQEVCFPVIFWTFSHFEARLLQRAAFSHSRARAHGTVKRSGNSRNFGLFRVPLFESGSDFLNGLTSYQSKRHRRSKII